MDQDTNAFPRVLALLALALVAVFSPRTGHAEDLRGLESAIAAALRAQGVPGASIAVTIDDRIVWARGIGVAENGGDRAVRLNTLFQAASISKPVAALATLRLVQDRRLSLDAPVARYLKNELVPAQNAVTLRQLLSHTSGLSVHGFAGYQRGAPVPELAQILSGRVPANSAPVILEGRPGAQFKYSGGGYVLVQQLIVDATGDLFPKAMATLVLSPLAMADSTYEQPLPKLLSSNAATGHDPNSRPVTGKWNTYPEMAAAGLWTTASDLARYVLAVQKAYSGRSGALIEREIAREMLTSQIQGGPGLGLFVSGDDPNSVFFHSGINNGYRCMITATKSVGRGLVIMTNSDNGDRAYQAIQQLVKTAFERN